MMFIEKHHVDKPGNRRLQIQGKKFGRLTVVKFHSVDPKRKESKWLCKCECGNEAVVRGYRLTTGHTKSCGCLNRERTIQASTTHGLSYEKLYFVWKAMISRCRNEENPNYHHYGGRGIKVCEEWEDIEVFYKWANDNGYKEGLELDRVDNNGDYEPTNCRFTTRKEQTLNTRRNVRATIEGVTKTLSEWSELYGIEYYTIQSRYSRGDRGKALVRPVETKYKGVTNV